MNEKDKHELYFTGAVRNNIMTGFPKKKIAEDVKVFNDMNIEMIIRKRRKSRTIRQNSTYWWYVQTIVDHTGYDRDEVHSILGNQFLKGEKVNENTGTVMPYVKSTADLSTVEMMEYQENIKRFAALEFEIVLPDPDPNRADPPQLNLSE